jgi:TIR domain-containing protein
LWVADVFISCVRADHDRVRQICERLVSLGYSVFWEKAPDTDSWREIDAARAVIVTWSNEGRHSMWMCAEASRAFDARKLLQIKLDATLPPPPFDVLGAFDVSGDRTEWGPLEAALADLARGGPAPVARPATAGLFATAYAAGAPKLITFALASSLIAYAGAVMEARNGVMNPDQLQLALTGVIGVAAASAALCIHRLVTIARAH